MYGGDEAAPNTCIISLNRNHPFLYRINLLKLLKTEFTSTYRVSYTAAFKVHRRYKGSGIPTWFLVKNCWIAKITKLQPLITFRSVTNDELLEEIKTLQSTVGSLTRQLNQLNLWRRQEQQEESTSTDKLQVGHTVELLTKAKHGKSGDKATVLHERLSWQ